MHEQVDRRFEGDEGDGGADWEGRRGPSATLIGLVALVAAAAVFVLQNSDRAKIRFLFFTVTARLWLAITVAIAIGVVLDRLFSIWWRRRGDR